MKKINFKQPKYIFPLIILLPILFLGYQISCLTGGGKEKQTGVVTDSIMGLPNAKDEDMKDKMAEMNSNFLEKGGYTALGELGQDLGEKDSTQSGYSESEMDRIDAENAKRKRQQEEIEEMQRRLEESRRRMNNASGYQGGNSSRREELDNFASELKYIQERNKARQRAYDKIIGGAEDDGNEISGTGRSGASKNILGDAQKTERTEIVEKAKDANAEKFNTLGETKGVDEPLIKAMIDQTTKAHNGTRLRFKLLDDVVIKKIKLKKGSYLYGTVTGFGQQRVMATITSILIKDKFIKVNLSVFDNDGMEGFYVPESAFRDMMKNAGAQAMGSSININNGMSSELNAESVALQALQNMYQSASSAVSANMRKNKARIKYNTIVYLINTSANTENP